MDRTPLNTLNRFLHHHDADLGGGMWDRMPERYAVRVGGLRLDRRP